MTQLEDIIKHRAEVQQNILKSFGVDATENSLEKGLDDEINPFEMEAYKSEISKAELDWFEKAKHQDGDMHPNGKWVWRQSANGGKGDWRVANPGKRGRKTAASASKTDATKKNSIYNKKLTDLTDEEFNNIYEDSKKMYHQILMNKNVNDVSKKSAEDAMKKLEDEKKRRESNKKESSSKSTSNESKFADMDIKEAKKKLVGKNLTFKDYWGDGKGGTVDATGKITNVRLYGKNKQPIASVEFENGDSATVSLKQIDEGKAAGYDLSLSDGSKTKTNTKNKSNRVDRLYKKWVDNPNSLNFKNWIQAVKLKKYLGKKLNKTESFYLEMHESSYNAKIKDSK